jgi:hypothetical protein
MEKELLKTIKKELLKLDETIFYNQKISDTVALDLHNALSRVMENCDKLENALK